jgi:hypothetical protein
MNSGEGQLLKLSEECSISVHWKFIKWIWNTWDGLLLIGTGIE